jgi:uncharacterized protein DUF955
LAAKELAAIPTMTPTRLNRSIRMLIAAGLHAAQGRIARRNARRRFFGALHSVRVAVDLEFPAVQKPGGKRDAIERAAAQMNWWCFEGLIIKHVKRKWDRDLARRFVSFVAARLGVEPKAIVFDLHGRRLAGQHARDRIRLNPDQSDRERWRTLIHELAHYRQHGHRRAFVRELAFIYRLWREFLAADSGRNPVDPAVQTTTDSTPLPTTNTASCPNRRL